MTEIMLGFMFWFGFGFFCEHSQDPRFTEESIGCKAKKKKLKLHNLQYF